MTCQGSHSIEARLPSRRGARREGTRRKGGGVGSCQPPANQVERACCSWRRMLMEKPLRLATCWANLDFLPGQNITSIGSSDNEETALAVMASTSPPA